MLYDGRLLIRSRVRRVWGGGPPRRFNGSAREAGTRRDAVTPPIPAAETLLPPPIVVVVGAADTVTTTVTDRTPRTKPTRREADPRPLPTADAVREVKGGFFFLDF